MLTFHYAPDGTAAIDNLTQRLIDELQAGKRVLWLLGGGSNIPLSVQVMQAISPELQANLIIGLTDERFGEFDHADSNVRQLRQAGFDAGQARFVPVLTQENLSLEDTVKAATANLAAALADAETVVAQLGIGPDGHICGMLPGSPAVTEAQLMSGYDAGTFTRITMTPPAVRQVQAAFAFAFGDAKRGALQQLQSENLPLETQPAQILKEISEAHLYSDQVTEQDTPDPEVGNPS